MTHRYSRFQSTLCITAVALACLGLSACGNKDDKGPATQVAAKVGDEEISVHQINQALSRTNTAGATPEQIATLSREALEKLIDQQLAITQATEDKLQRTPEVVARLELARREILAQAYLQEITRDLPKPTPDEVKKYYTDHPALFAERRIFNVQEITAENTDAASELLRGYVSNNRPIEEIVSALKARQIKFSGGPASRTAEQIPLDLLPKVQQLRDGQAMVLVTPHTVVFLRMVSSQAQPVTEEQALPRIEQFMVNQRASTAIAEHFKKLRADTKITYMGEFQKSAAEVAAAASAAAQAPAAAASTQKTELEKGIANLK